MISATRIEALTLLTELWELSPDVRFRQSFADLGCLGEDQTGRLFGVIDDEQLLAVLYHHRTEMIDQKSEALNQALQQFAAT